MWSGETLRGAFGCCASLLAAHCWLLAIGCSLLVAHYWLLTVRYSECDAAGVECTHEPIFSPGAAPLNPAQPRMSENRMIQCA